MRGSTVSVFVCAFYCMSDVSVPVFVPSQAFCGLACLTN